MALSEKQIGELNIAQTRVDQGKGTETDVANLEFATGQGFKPVTAGKAEPVSATPTTPVKLDVAEAIPESVFNEVPVSVNDISQQLLASQQTQQQQTQTFLDEFKSLSEQSIEATKPSEVETGLISDIQDITQQARQLRSSFKAGVDKITGQSIPMSIAMGQTRELENQANRRLEMLSISQAPLIDTLNTLQSAREVKLTQLNILSQFARENFAFLQSNTQANRQLQLQIFQIQQQEQQYKKEEARFALDFAIENGVTSRFFKFPDDPTVYDLQQSGKPLTFKEYQQVTGQVGKKPQNTLFDNVQTLSPQVEPGDFQFIPETDTQVGGKFNRATGKFTPFDEQQIVPISTVQPSGGLQTTEINDRALSLDSVAIPSLDVINEQASQFGGLKIGAVASSTYRTSEQQQKLYKKFLEGGSQAAPPGFSAHERGMAVDLFPDQGYISQMKPIMNANGWFQTAGNDDLGHFEYLGEQPESALQLDPEVQSAVDLVEQGRLTDKEALEKIDKDKKDQLFTALANIQPFKDTAQDAILTEKVDLATNLKDHKGLNSSVGTTKLGRGKFKFLPFTKAKDISIDKLTGVRQDFIGNVERLVSGLSLDSLIAAKSRGATFGALSDTEMQILTNAASNIGTWRVTDEDGNVLGYNIGEKKFKEELDRISQTLASTIKNREVSDSSDPLGILNNNNPLGL